MCNQHLRGAGTDAGEGTGRTVVVTGAPTGWDEALCSAELHEAIKSSQLEAILQKASSYLPTPRPQGWMRESSSWLQTSARSLATGQ